MTHLPHFAAASAALFFSAIAHAQCGPQLDSAVTLQGAAQTAMASADFDHDGIVDLCLLNGSSFEFQHGGGDGTFTALFQANIGPSLAIALGDFNTDGHLDVAFLNSTAIAIYHGNGLGSFTPRAPLPFGASNGIALCATDVDSDGRTDLLVLCGTNGRNISKLRNLGSGSFAAPVNSPLIEADASCLAAADLDANGTPEVVVGSPSTASLGFYTESNGMLQQVAQRSTVQGVFAIVLTDTNSDGIIDICAAGSTFNQVHVVQRFTTADLTNGYSGNQFAIPGLRGLAVGDINGDQNADLLGAGTSGLGICVNGGNGFFYSPQQFTGFSGSTIAAPDLLADGSPDILVGTSGNPGSLVRFLSHVVTLPVITAQPQAIDVQTGSPATFTVVANGGSTLAYQWYRGGTALSNGNGITGADTATLSISAVTFADHLTTFSVRITNACGTTTSVAAALGVRDCPGDFNHDGTVDFFDYLDFVDAFSIGC